MSRTANLNYDVLNDLVNSGQLVANIEHHRFDFADASQPLRLTGRGNDSLRQNFADKLFGLDDEHFVREAESYIWLSAWAANNPNSDYHWMCDACYHESRRRGNVGLYERAWHQASGM